MKHTARMLCIGLVALSLAACSRDDEKESIKVNALVLSEGAWGANNASIIGLDTRNGRRAACYEVVSGSYGFTIGNTVSVK